MVKEFAYRGKSLEELKNLEVREFAKYADSRTRRTILRQFQEIEQFITKCKTKSGKKKQIKTHSRQIVIVPQLVGFTVQIHDGKTFVPIEIVPDMIGHRLGEFSPTRARIKHGSAGMGATKGSKVKKK